MKKVTLLFMFCFCGIACTGCNSGQLNMYSQSENESYNHSVKENSDMQIKDEGKFEGVVDASAYSIDFSDGSSLNGLTVDAKLALAIGNAVIEERNGREFIEKTRCVICEVRDVDVFVITRLHKVPQAGGDINIAISKVDGRIVAFWGGE